jgi:outer membrane protein TolC
MRRISQASIDLDALQSRIASEVEDVFEYRLQSRKAVELWQKNVELAKRGYQIAEDKYRNGTMTNVDVLDSQVALIDARVQYLKALYDYNVARAEFVRVIKIQ